MSLISLEAAFVAVADALTAPHTKAARGVPLREAAGRVLAADVTAAAVAAGTAGDATPREPGARAGERLDPCLVAALLSRGVERVTVARAPRVAIAALAGEPAAADSESDWPPGELRCATPALLQLTLAARGWPAGAHQPIPGGLAALKARLAGMLGQHDVVVLAKPPPQVSGGDDLPAALAALALTPRFDGVAVEPGGATLLATGERGVVFALPGDPAAAFVAAHLFVAPALARLEGARERPRFVALPLAEAWRGEAHDSARLLPAQIAPDGRALLATGSGDEPLRALSAADGLVRIEARWTACAAGEPVAFWPLRVAGADAAT